MLLFVFVLFSFSQKEGQCLGFREVLAEMEYNIDIYIYICMVFFK